MVRIGMPVICGRWKGRVWAIHRGHVISLENGPIDCDYKVHAINDIVVSKGIAIAPRDAEMGRKRIARSWERADG